MNLSLLFKEAHRLYKLGFAVLWLHPRSKRPIGNAWAQGPKKPWHELKDTYQESFNLGVRLGTPSKIDDKGYLAVIDVDIKSADKKHRLEALAALKNLIGDAKCPEVRSGRGNGSRHLYCVTEKPFKTWNPFESKDEVKVMMPSKSPSKRELKELTPVELKKGLRLSRAWEISLYSDGRQVVLPPSIHPDTGKPYFWKEHLTDLSSLPLLSFGEPEENENEEKESKPRGPQETVEDFEIDETLDVRWLPELSDAARSLIVDGIWRGEKITDRSAYLLLAANSLVSAGLNKNGVLTVLTDPSTVLGQCAYDHAQTNSRKRAAKWLWNYTVKQVMEDRDPVAAFKNEAVVNIELGGEGAKEQTESLEEETDWKNYLEKTDKGKIRPTFNNLKTIVTNVCSDKKVLGRNEFANNDYYLCNTPWRSRQGDAVTDVDIDRIKEFAAENFGVEFHDNLINQVLRVLADSNRFHPVKEYLKGLDWDGTPRLETWLKDFANAIGPEKYLRAVSRKVLVAMVKRVFEPGCKFDHVLILEGIQGTGKSTLLSNLAKPWFTDEQLNVGDKDAVLTMQSKWLIELGELSALSRADLETLKAFITRTTDRIRAPYGKRIEEYPRQCIFIGSTNKDEYLRDETGNRRFWPVRCGKIDFEGLAKIRDQLFAEAVGYYRLREPLYLETAELNALAQAEQEMRNEVDEWFGAVADIVNGEIFPRHRFEMRELASKLDQFGAHKLDKSDQLRIAKILKHLGFERFQESTGQRRKLWRQVRATNQGNLSEPLS